MAAQREETVYGSGSDDTDNVSLTDTVASDADNEYGLDGILAEADFDIKNADGTIGSETRYLIKWSGYSKYRSTWEPASNFVTNGDDALFEWQEEKMRRLRGLKEEFDVEDFEEWRQDVRARISRRHQRRNKKRTQLNLPLVQYSSDDDESDDEDYVRDSGDQFGPDDSDLDLDVNRIFSPGGHRKRRVVDSDSDDGVRRINKRNRQSDAAENPPRVAARSPKPQAQPIRRDSAYTPVSTTISAQNGERTATTVGPPRQQVADQLRNAPIANMTGGPSRKGTRTLKGQVNSTFRNIFESGSTKQRRQSTTRQQGPENFRNLKHQNNARKKLMREAVPRIETLNLKDPATGQILSAPATKSQESVVVQRRHSYDVSTSPSPVNQLKTKAASAQTSPQDFLLTCWFWATGHCRFRENCGLAHYHTGEVAPPKNISKELFTCPHWFSGKCIKSARDCLCAHRVTNYLAGDGTNPTRKLDKQEAERIIAEMYDDRDRDSLFVNESYPSSKSLTCFFWFFSRCNKPEENCKFAHEVRDYVAGRPGEQNIPTRNHPRLSELPGSTAPWTPNTRSAQNTGTYPSVYRPANSPSPPRRSPAENSQTYPPTFVLPYAKTPIESPNKSMSDSSDPEKSLSVIVKFGTVAEASNKHDYKLTVRFSGMDRVILENFKVAAGFEPTFGFKHICCAETLKKILDTSKVSKLGSGLVSASSSDPALRADETDTTLEILAENLKACSGGAISYQTRFTVIIFPTGQSAWKFLGSLPSTATNVKLQFQLLSPLKPPPSSLRTIDQGPTDFDMDPLLSRFDGKTEKNIFLVISPSKRQQWGNLMFIACKLGANVYHSLTKGSWDFFCSKLSSGVVLFEADFYAFHQMPDFYHRILTNKFNIFRVSSLSPPSFEPLFPQGQAAYFSDSCFREQPSDALKALDHLKTRLKNHQATQILGRPGLLDWLLEMTAEQREAAKNDSVQLHISGRWKSIYELLSKLLDDHLMGLSRTEILKLRNSGLPPRSAPPVTSPVYYPSTAELPDFEAIWQKEGDDAKKTAAADDMMIEWFAGWAISRSTTLRRFTFFARVSEQTVDRWKEKYRHLNITSVDKYLARGTT